MATRQSLFPGCSLDLNSSLATVVLCSTAVFHWCISVWRLLGLLVVTMHLQVQTTPPTQYVQARGKSVACHLRLLHLLVLLLQSSLSSPSLWASVLPSDPSGSWGPTPILFLSLTAIFQCLDLKSQRGSSSSPSIMQFCKFFKWPINHIVLPEHRILVDFCKDHMSAF